MFIGTMVSGNPESLNYVGNNRSCDHRWLMLWKRTPESRFLKVMCFDRVWGFSHTLLTSRLVLGMLDSVSALPRSLARSMGPVQAGLLSLEGKCLSGMSLYSTGTEPQEKGSGPGLSCFHLDLSFHQNPLLWEGVGISNISFPPSSKKVQTLPFDLYVYSF